MAVLMLWGRTGCPSWQAELLALGATAERPSVQPRDLQFPSTGQDRQLIPTLLEGFLQAYPHPSPA